MSIAAKIISRRRILAIFMALSLGLAACGADETIDAGAGGIPAEESVDNESTDDRLPEDETVPDAQELDAQEEDATAFTPMTPRTDLINLEVSEPEVSVDPKDDSRLLIHFEGAAEPCSGAAVSVTETDSDVAIIFQTGLDPNAAAMSCIAQVFQYEIVIQLDAPLGDRTIGFAN